MAFGLKRLKNWGKKFKTTWSFTVINAGNDDDTCAAETQKHRNHRKNTYTHRLHLKCFWFLFSLSLVHLFNFNLCNMIALNGAFRWILFHFIWLWASFDGPHNSWLAKKRRHIQPVRCQVCEFPQGFLFVCLGLHCCDSHMMFCKLFICGSRNNSKIITSWANY